MYNKIFYFIHNIQQTRLPTCSKAKLTVDGIQYNKTNILEKYQLVLPKHDKVHIFNPKIFPCVRIEAFTDWVKNLEPKRIEAFTDWVTNLEPKQ